MTKQAQHGRFEVFTMVEGSDLQGCNTTYFRQWLNIRKNSIFGVTEKGMFCLLPTLHDLTLQPWKWSKLVPPKCWAFSEPHGITTQDTILFQPTKCSHSTHCKPFRSCKYSLTTTVFKPTLKHWTNKWSNGQRLKH
jgi:hypothetical protein